MSVYFIQAGRNGPIKIGWAVDVGVRMKILQCAHYEELFLLREVPGARSAEAWFHRHFKNKQIRGEWFRFAPEMLAIVPPALVDRLPAVMKLRDFLDQQSISYADFGKTLGVTGEAVRLWTVGQRIPSREYMRLISKITAAAVTANDFHEDAAA